MAERQLPKLHTGVRFPSPAPPLVPSFTELIGTPNPNTDTYGQRTRSDPAGFNRPSL